ncbi:MAG: glycosyltransferase family 39 protein, partial [Planctomycetota bacterium]|nr:glycosyltransferase family 39 protein [Planctomycetota bacterium]
MTATPVSSSPEIAVHSDDIAARERSPDRTRRIAAVALLLLLAAWMRFRDLDRQSLWFDEGVTAWIAAKPLGELIEAVKLWENTPPLHYLVVAGAIRLFGDTDFVARCPSALAGVACVWLVYRIGAYLFDWRVGIAAALWMAISPFHILFSQEVRAYMLMQFLALASCYCFLRLLDGAPGRWMKPAYVVSTSLLLWSQLYGIFVPVAQNLCYFGLLALRTAPRPPVKWWVAMQ